MASLLDTVGRWFVVLFIAYLVWHLWLLDNHQTPDQFVAGLRAWLTNLGPSLMPDLGGAITGR